MFISAESGSGARLDSNCQEAVSSTNVGISERAFRLTSFATLICDPARIIAYHMPRRDCYSRWCRLYIYSILRPCLRCCFAAGVQA